MIDLQTISVTIAATGVTIAAIYYIMILRNAQRSRQMGMLMQLYQSRYDSEGMQRLWKILSMEWDDFDHYMEKYSLVKHPEREEGALVSASFGFYDGLGILVKDKMVDVNTVYRMFGLRILMVWYKFETLIKGFRELEGGVGAGSDYVENFEYLANEMIKFRKERGVSLPLYWLHPTSTLHPELKT